MGPCSSKANTRRKYSPLKQPSTSKNVTTRISTVTREVNPDFRVVIVAAYIHHIQHSCHIIQKIHQPITFLIIAYFPKYTIYGIKSSDIEANCKFKKLNQFENTLFNIKDIYAGQNRFFINNIYSEIQSFNGFKYSHNAGSINQSHQKQNQLFHIPKIELIRNSHSSHLNKWVQYMDIKKKHRGIAVDIVQIECGISHVLMLSSKGNVHSMGLNHHGECGISKYQANVQQPTLIAEFVNKQCNIHSISCGDYHNCCVGCIESNVNVNTMWTFGKNQYKQCDENSSGDVLIPIFSQRFKHKNIIKANCGKDFTICLDNNGVLMFFGNILIEYDNVELMEMNTYVEDFSVGYDHIIIVNDEKQISMVKQRECEFVQSRTCFFIDDDSFESFPTTLTIDVNSTLCDMITASQYSIMIFQMTNN